MFSYNWFKSIYSWKDDGSMKPADQQEDQPGDQQQDQLKARDDEDPEAVEDPYKDVPIDPDTEDESTMTTEFPWPKAYNMENHPRSLITAGGCFVV
jgi:hypothetical protein